MTDSHYYTVKWTAGTFSGTRTVLASDGAHAVSMVRSAVRRDMIAPMYAESYEVIDEHERND